GGRHDGHRPVDVLRARGGPRVALGQPGASQPSRTESSPCRLARVRRARPAHHLRGATGGPPAARAPSSSAPRPLFPPPPPPARAPPGAPRGELTTPALSTGRRAPPPPPLNPNALQLTSSDGKTTPWGGGPTVFSRARPLGYDGGGVGGPLPYPRVLGGSLGV